VSTPALFADVARIVADVLGVDPARISPASSPDTLESWDSVQHLNIVIALEQELGVRFTPEEIEEAVGVQAIVDLVERKRA
jgi:acyl carrier protein